MNEESGGVPRRALVVTVSDRSAAGIRPDGSGPIAVAELRRRGWDVDAAITPDGEPVVAVLEEAVAGGYPLVLTTGGTGLAARDLTPEMTSRVIDRLVPGIPELLRADGLRITPTAILSRGIAGAAGTTLIVNLPGSPGAVRDAMRVLFPAIDHAVEHLHGQTEHPAGGLHSAGHTPGHTPGHGTGRRHQCAGPPAPADPGSSDRCPPVVLRAEVGSEPVDVADLEALVADPSCGAVVTFAGVIRNHDHGASVAAVEYSAHPTAGDLIGQVAARVAQSVGVGRFAVVHRAGSELTIGDVALGCAVATPHRAEAFAGCGELVEAIKREIPIWKRQTLTDGTVEWVNCP